MDNTMEKLIDQRQKAQEIKESSNMAEFFAKVTNLTQTMEKCLPPPCSITSGELQLLQGSEVQPNIVGALQHEKINRVVKPKMVISKKHVTEETVVQFLTAGPGNSLWYSCNIDEIVLKRVKNFQIISKINLMVYGMVCIPGYGLLISTYGETLKIIPENSDEVLDSRFSIDPLEPKCLHMTKDNKLAIGAISKGPLYPASGQRVVILMDMEGNKLSTFEYNQKGKRLLTHPWGIASTTNGNIFILDRINRQCVGRLVVLKRDDGSVIDMYNGREKQVFIPRGIVATQADNIIISDCDDPEVSLHILDNSGNLLTYYDTRDIGIELPFSLTVSSIGLFYIGGTIITNSGKRAELFEISFDEM
ncbi:Hypothetical predicted protein [Mytilus galloprovincialis]|uniref:Uncharacterized protein n=1 Tax=Mytilus galloprovincialis TaxID=29158 RepID=A0A8B6BQ92_MYTGA|nr:Hypothetical predicted protein [Mytilus galloprovincialis]